MTRLRREIHRRPEEGWTEFETQWKVFRALEALGWTIRMGLDVIRPEAVMSASEVLTAPSAALLEQAWGRPAFDVYAATETAGIAAMCPRVCQAVTTLSMWAGDTRA